jgi:hypothetical protein
MENTGLIPSVSDKRRLVFLFFWAISIFFHPLLLFFYAACILCNTTLFACGSACSSLLLIELFTVGVLLPVLLIGILKISGLVNGFSLENRSDRHIPHLFTFLLYLLLSVFLRKITPLPGPVQAMLPGTALCIGLVGLITLWWKISSHLAGIGGISGFFLAFYLMFGRQEFLLLLFLSLMTAVLIAIARWYLKAHDKIQLVAGFFLGMLCSSVSVCFFAELF